MFLFGVVLWLEMEILRQHFVNLRVRFGQLRALISTFRSLSKDKSMVALSIHSCGFVAMLRLIQEHFVSKCFPVADAALYALWWVAKASYSSV